MATLLAVGLGGGTVVGAGVVTVTSPDGLNLRSSPSTQAQVLAVIPLGSLLNLTGDPTADGWYPVSLGSASGWAYGAYLMLGQVTSAEAAAAAAPLASAPPSAATASTATAPATTAVTVSSVAGASVASAGAPAVQTMAASQGTTPSASVSTSAPALLGAPTLVMTVNTDALNLRMAPTLASNVLTAAPKGTSVQVMGTPVNNWLPVNLNGLAGWMDSTYLASAANAYNSSSSTANSATTLTAAALGNPTLGTPAGPEAGLALAVLPPTTSGEFVWPVKDSRRITTTFKSIHQAIDVDQFPGGGNPALATADGEVTFAGGDACCSYGLYVIIKHRDGFSSLYSHLSKVEVSQGQMVKQGTEVGLTGNTGNSTGPHIHFALYYNGLPFDPLKVLPGPTDVWSGA